jgi:haloalkane dehalogenase
MGGSGKLHPSGPDRYNYAEQRDYLFALWDTLDLGDNVTLVLHDWGSVLGFDWANQHRDRVRGVAFMEAIVAPMAWSEFPSAVRQLFEGFQRCPESAAYRQLNWCELRCATKLSPSPRRRGSPE